MSKYNLTSYYTTFKITLYMAEEYYKECQEDEGEVTSFSSIKDFEMGEKERELFDFLNSLDYEVVKTLQVIMYIGRDSSCMEKDGTYNYEETRKYFDKRGWNSKKSIEVNQMVEKFRLAEYLKKGFEKLNIVI